MLGESKYLGRPQAHDGAGALFLDALGLELVLELAALEGDGVLAAVAVDGDFEALRKRVRHRDAHAVQAAGDVIDALAGFRELAARVQHAEGDFHRGLLLLRVHVHRDAAALVLDLDRAVLEHAHGDALAVAGERLVHRVVDRLLHDVQGMHGVRVHPRHAPHGLQALEGLNGGGVVDLLFGHVSSSGARPDN
jgi:hypothetical protein